MTELMQKFDFQFIVAKQHMFLLKDHVFGDQWKQNYFVELICVFLSLKMSKTVKI